jgi:uncharacterized protein (DUF433 family)
MDWSHCEDVERVRGKVSGAWVVVGTRIPADDVLANARDGLTAEQIVREVYQGLPLQRARRVIRYGLARLEVA